MHFLRLGVRNETHIYHANFKRNASNPLKKREADNHIA